MTSWYRHGRRVDWARTRRAGAIALLLVGTAAGLLAATPAGDAGAIVVTPPGGSYVPLTPTRIVDTRNFAGNTNAYKGRTLAGWGTLVVPIPTADVPSGASAIVANVTVTGETTGGYLTVFPTPSSPGAPPNVSNLNFSKYQTVPNLVTVPVSSTGKVSFYNGSAGTTDLIVDLEGYYNAPAATSGGAGHYVALSPARIADTRKGAPSTYAGDTLGAGSNPESLAIRIDGAGGVPGAGVSAVVVNVTVVANAPTSKTSYLTVWPGVTGQPNASNLNWKQGRIVANRVMVPVGSNGHIEVANAFGTADVIVDVNGYFSDASGSDSAGSLFDAVAPTRLMDTRNGTGGHSGPLSSGQTVGLQVAGTSPVPGMGNAHPPVAGVFNVTAVGPSAVGYLTVFPNGTAPPNSSDVNFAKGAVVPNMDAGSLSAAGKVQIYDFGASTNVLVDVFGYFTPAMVGANTVSVVASPSTLPADGGSTSSVTVTVTTPTGAPVSGAVITLLASGSGCGTLSSGTETTGPNGQTPADTDTASFSAGSCTILATQGATGADGRAVILQVTPVDSISLAASSQAVPDDGSSTSTITATVMNTLGAPHNGVTVTFSKSANPAGSCGTLSAPSASTAGSGTASVTYTAPTKSGLCTVTALISGASAQIAIAATIGTPSSSFSLSNIGSTAKLPMPADGDSTTVIQATVKDANGLKIAKDPVSFTGTGDCGRLSSGPAVTASDGVAVVTYTAAAVPGTCTVNIIEGDTGGTGSLGVTQSSVPDVVSVGLSPDTVAATASSTSVVLVTVEEMGVPVTNDPLSLSASCGTLSASSGFTNSGGQLSVAFTATSTPGICTVTATETAGTGSSGVGYVVQTNGVPALHDTVVLSPAAQTVPADGATSATLSATVTTPAGALVSGDKVAAELSSPVPGVCGTLASAIVSTNAKGVATFTYTAGLALGTCAVVAKEANTGGAAFGAVTQSQPAAVIETGINGAPSALPFGPAPTGGPPVPVNVLVTNVDGSPRAGDALSVTPISLSANACGPLAATSGVTDLNGTFTTTYSPGSVGYCAFLIFDTTAGGRGEGLAVQTLYPSTAPPVTLNVYSSPPYLAADGKSTSTITMSVTDSDGHAVPNDPVILVSPTLLPPSFFGSPTCGAFENSFLGIGIVTGFTDANGVFRATYLASTTVHNTPACLFLTKEAFDDKTTFGGIVQGPLPTVTSPVMTITPPTVAAGGSEGTLGVMVTATVNSASGTGLEGAAVTVVSPTPTADPSTPGACGTLHAQVYLTGNVGNLSIGYLPSSVVGFCKITLKMTYQNGSQTLTTQATVEVVQTDYSVVTPLTLTALKSGSTVRATVTDANSVPVSGDPVLFALSAASVGACNGVSLTPPSGGTSASGVIATTFTTPPKAGCDVIVTEADSGATQTVAIS